MKDPRRAKSVAALRGGSLKGSPTLEGRCDLPPDHEGEIRRPVLVIHHKINSFEERTQEPWTNTEKGADVGERAGTGLAPAWLERRAHGHLNHPITTGLIAKEQTEGGEAIESAVQMLTHMLRDAAYGENPRRVQSCIRGLRGQFSKQRNF